MNAQVHFDFLGDSEPAETDPSGRLVLVPDHEQHSLFDVPTVRLREVPKPRSLFNGTPLNDHELQFRSQAATILAEHQRPQRRADCLAGGFNEQRPCPFVSCRHHLGIDVNDNGSIKLNFPKTVRVGDHEYLTEDYLDLDAAPATCVLDESVDDHTDLEVGERINCAESNVARIEHAAIAEVREAID